MKKVVVFVILAMVLIGSCAAQSATNDAQRLVGTWVSENGWTLVFNANGTGTCSGSGSRDGNIFWGVSASGGLSIVYREPLKITKKNKFILYLYYFC